MVLHCSIDGGDDESVNSPGNKTVRFTAGTTLRLKNMN